MPAPGRQPQEGGGGRGGGREDALVAARLASHPSSRHLPAACRLPKLRTACARPADRPRFRVHARGSGAIHPSPTVPRRCAVMTDKCIFSESSSVETAANNYERDSDTVAGEGNLSGQYNARQDVHRYGENAANLGFTDYMAFAASDGSFQKTHASAEVMQPPGQSLIYNMENQFVIGVNEWQNDNFRIDNDKSSSRYRACHSIAGSSQAYEVDHLQLDHKQGVHSSSIKWPPDLTASTLHELYGRSILDSQPFEIDQQTNSPMKIHAKEVEALNNHDAGNSQIGDREVDTHKKIEQMEDENEVLKLPIAMSVYSNQMRRTLAIQDKKLRVVSRKANENFDNLISLREWLGKRGRIVNRIESLHIFQQIVVFVEIAHSQGVALQNIRPSSFLLSSFNQISYIESTHTHASSGSSEHSVSEPEDPDGTKDDDLMGDSDPPIGEMLSLSGREHGRRMTAVIPSLKQGVTQLGSDFGLGNGCSLEFSENETQTASSGDGPNCSEEASVRMRNQVELAISFPLKQMLSIEQTWYRSYEELSDASYTFSSDVYCLGVLLFELFCSFGSEMEWLRAMSDVRHRVLPPRLLLEHPKESAFCLLLLHPDPNSRPKARDVLQSDLLNEVRDELTERQAAISAEEKQSELEQTLEFLLQLQCKKKQELCLLNQVLAFITSDIEEVERRKYFLRQVRGGESRYMDDRFGNREPGIIDRKIVVLGNRPYGQESQTQLKKKDMENIHDKRHDIISSINTRLMSNFDQFKKIYLTLRGNVKVGNSDAVIRTKSCNRKGKGSSFIGTPRSSIGFENQIVEKINSRDFLGCFLDGLCKFIRFDKFEVKANLQHSDFLSTSNMVCSIGFDRENEFFATAGSCKRIKIFEFNAILDDSVNMHYPVMEITASSKLSCICWNSYIKSHIASSNHDGIVQLWDINTCQPLIDLKEHAKRAWSVDFSQVDPTKLVSGSDDYSIKLWSINQKSSVGTIKTMANVCSVQFSPDSSYLLASGSADHRILCYDLRNIKTPMHILEGHKKAVSFVRFVDQGTLASASCDNTIRLWDITNLHTALPKNACTMTFSGHTNEKNFVGLSIANDGYIACGSETNEAFAYYRSFPMPVMSHKFRCSDPVSGEEIEDRGRQFVSSVCWRGNSHTLLAASSMGSVKVLEMV